MGKQCNWLFILVNMNNNSPINNGYNSPIFCKCKPTFFLYKLIRIVSGGLYIMIMDRFRNGWSPLYPSYQIPRKPHNQSIWAMKKKVRSNHYHDKFSKLQLLFFLCAASTKSCEAYYVIGLSVCLSVHPKFKSLFFLIPSLSKLCDWVLVWSTRICCAKDISITKKSNSCYFQFTP